MTTANNTMTAIAIKAPSLETCSLTRCCLSRAEVLAGDRSYCESGGATHRHESGPG